MDTRGMTDKEVLFCEVYVNGTAPYGGNAERCYREVFKEEDILVGQKARDLMSDPVVAAYIGELEKDAKIEASTMKRYLTQNLKKILDETSTAEFRDRKGQLISPAPLRSVAVNAAKALMDMYPVREAQVSKLNIDGDGETGITFNVIVPGSKSENN